MRWVKLLTALGKAKVYTRMSFVDEKYFYIEQKIMRKGKPIASCFAIGLAKKGRKTVPTSEIINTLKIEDEDVPAYKHELITLLKAKNNKMTERIIDNWRL